MLLNAFDRNHNGKLDPEERPALVEFLIKRDEQPGQVAISYCQGGIDAPPRIDSLYK